MPTAGWAQRDARVLPKIHFGKWGGRLRPRRMPTSGSMSYKGKLSDIFILGGERVPLMLVSFRKTGSLQLASFFPAVTPGAAEV